MMLFSKNPKFPFVNIMIPIDYNFEKSIFIGTQYDKIRS